MALPPAFLEELRARTPLPALVGRRVKLSRSGRNWKGCCPFHNERSPSFYVYEDGYHCFGCGAHGDAISFVMQTGGASFPDAVAQLAAEAGLEVPKPTPAAAEAERRRLDLRGVLDAAASRYQRLLRAPEGAAALAYLRGRGLTDDTIARFGLGWSGDGRGGLLAELSQGGADASLLLRAGLLREAENGPAREMFFGRVMFPIRDRKGGVVSFGGRTLGDAKPKYVNGPETEIFQKKRTLYGLDQAARALREPAPQGGKAMPPALVVVEGYMDVIALHQAGHRGAVAPLGTALTEDQMQELWRLSPAPVLCFDGDAAGRRAALRAMEAALPHLSPERTLRFALLPEGEDPDTLVLKGGHAAFQAVLDAARPFSEALFDAMGEGVGASPEARAAFRTRFLDAVARIGDKSLAAEMRSAFFERLRGPRNPRGSPRGAPSRGRDGRPAPGHGPGHLLPRLARPSLQPDAVQAERARNLVAILIHHPAQLHDVEEAFLGLHLPPALDRLRIAMLAWADATHAAAAEADATGGDGSVIGLLDSAGLLSHLAASGLAAEAAQALSADPVPLAACARADAMPAEAGAGWWHLFGLLNRSRLEQEVAAARRDFVARADEAAQRRLVALTAALHGLAETDPADAEP